MRLFVTVKSLGKRKPVLSKLEMKLPGVPGTLRELIAATVALNIQALINKQENVALIPYLTSQEVQDGADTGKVGFGAVYNEAIPDPNEAVETAVQAFEDGLYKVFIREEEITVLNDPLTIADGDELMFIRFTMLAGSLW